MSDGSKPLPLDLAELATLRQENAALQQRVAQLQTVLNGRSVPVVATVVDGLAALVTASRAGDANARQLLAEWREALRAVQTAGSGIVVPNGAASLPRD
jgi:hypothetical protein